METSGATVYRCYDKRDRLLYVGWSTNVATRLKHHRYRTKWGKRIARHTEQYYECRSDAGKEEKRAIREERPVHNVLGHPDKLHLQPRAKEREFNKTFTPELREAWLEVGPGLDARLAACGKAIGQTLTRADRHWLYARYGKPGAPK